MPPSVEGGHATRERSEPGQSWPGRSARTPELSKNEPIARIRRLGFPIVPALANRRIASAARKLRDFLMLAFGGKHATRN